MKKKFWMFLYKINYYLINKLVPSDNVYYVADGLKYNINVKWVIVGKEIIGYLEKR